MGRDDDDLGSVVVVVGVALVFEWVATTVSITVTFPTSRAGKLFERRRLSYGLTERTGDSVRIGKMLVEVCMRFRDMLFTCCLSREVRGWWSTIYVPRCPR